MSEHLHECPNRPYNGERCICDRLRAALAAQATAHEAALVEAERRGFDNAKQRYAGYPYSNGVSDERARWEAGGPWFRVSKVEAYEKGVADATARIRAGVDDMQAMTGLLGKRDVLAVIDGAQT